jgi:hypothetical protein
MHMSRILLSVMLCLLCAATIHAQIRPLRGAPPPQEELNPEPPPPPIVAPPSEPSGVDSFITGLLFLSIIAFMIVMFAVAARFWVRYSPTTDLEKLAMSDPWTRAYLEQQNADDDSTLTDPGVGSPNGARRKQ